jgi:hypothetical protein
MDHHVVEKIGELVVAQDKILFQLQLVLLKQ